MKNNFSSNIQESLNGRSSTGPNNPVPEENKPQSSSKKGNISQEKTKKPKKENKEKAPTPVKNSKIVNAIPTSTDVAEKPVDVKTPVIHEQAAPSITNDIPLKPDKGLGKNLDGTYRQSNAGRHAVDPTKKKTQMVVTLMPTTRQELENWAEGKPRSAANYLSEYIESRLQDIMDYFDRI